MHTSLCDLLGIRVPILQAPMGFAASPALVAAVGNAGGLGALALGPKPLDEVRTQIAETRARTTKPFAVNLVLTRDQDERLGVVLDAGTPAVIFSWGDPAAFVARVHRAGAKMMHVVGSATEARRAADAGVDVIVAQGWEAGGHVFGSVATMALVPRVVDAVAPAPVVAAGGIADGRGVAAALALGASGAMLGTRFLASAEAAIHPRYRELLLAAGEADTVHTGLFDVGWPNAPHRVLRNGTVAAWEAAGSPAPGARPGEGGEVARSSVTGLSIVRYQSRTPSVDVEGDIDAMSLWAGQGVGLAREVRPAAEIVRELERDADAVLARLAPRKA
jgi:NAD(P)H-dependent flavin oxidoreductase YrpB (nitropropane dioxygenase family)